MTDKEKIRLWAKGRLFELLNGIGEQDAKSVLPDLLSFIDSMQEEPVSEDLEEEINSWLDEGLPNEEELVDHIKETARHFAIWQKQKDQETIKLAEDHAMLAGMEKMKEQMIKDAIDYRINDMPNQPPIVLDHYRIYEKGIRAGDKVKLIIIKED